LVQPVPAVTKSRSHASSPDDASDLRLLFHRLNNQLGIVLAHSELLESKLPDEDPRRARASQVVMATLEAMNVTRAICDLLDGDRALPRAALPPTDRPALELPLDVAPRPASAPLDRGTPLAPDPLLSPVAPPSSQPKS
jgi:hypothetical protein